MSGGRAFGAAAAILIVGCGPSETPPLDTAGDDPSPYVYETEDAVPTLSLEEIAAGIEAGLAAYVSFDPRVVHEVYARVRIGDDDCPTYSESYYKENERWYWNDTCETEGGASFTGWAYSSFYDESVTDGDYRYDLYGYLSTSSKIRDEQGQVFEGSGYSYFYERIYKPDEYDYRTWHNRTYGYFRWDGDEAVGTWLDDGLLLDLTFSSTYYPSYPGRYVSMSGSLFGFGDPVDAMMVESLYFYDESMGSGCEEEPFGAIAVRSTDGSWYEVQFEGPSYWGGPVFPPDCDGCGEATFQGEPMGLVCPDFSALTDWEGATSAPWGN